MESVVFTNIIVHEFKIPIRPRPGDAKMRMIGAYQLVAMLQGLEALTLRLCFKHLGWSSTEMGIALAKVKGEFKQRTFNLLAAASGISIVHLTFALDQVCRIWTEA